MSNIEDISFSSLIQISADDRLTSSETPSDFTVDLGQASFCNRAIRCVLKTCIFPNIFYNIRTDVNDKFTFRENGQPAVELTVPQGFYNSSSLASSLQTLINASLTVGSVAITTDPLTLLMTFTFTGITAIIYGEPETTMASNVGIVNGSSGAYVASYVGEQIPQLQGLTEIFIQSLTLAPSNLVEQKSIVRNVFIPVPITAPFGAINVFECKDDELCSINYQSPRDLRYIDIKMTDRRGNLLDFQGHNVKLVFKIYYQ